MTQDTFHLTLDTLRREREGAERDAVELAAKLENVNNRLGHLRRAIESIEALLGVPSVDDEAVLDDAEDESAKASVRDIDFTNTPDPDDVDPDFGPSEPVRKRVPSTEWAAEVVNAIGRPADRDEIFEAFGQIKGFPQSWTNARNSVNNALGRAVERKLVMKVDADRFAPINYNPFEDHFPERGSRGG